VRITCDPAADAVYIGLTGEPLTPGRTTIQAGTPPAIDGFIALDWKDDASSASRSSTPAAACTPTSSRKPKPPADGPAGRVPARPRP
jgi:hypothetical protein